jgi:peroxiredoxin Q/BCP
MLKYAMLVALFCCACVTFAADKSAQQGQPLPEINAIDENGQQVSLNSYKGKNGLIIFFFPKAFTGGCVCENAGFRDYLSKYQDKGYAVVGASRDEPATLVKFKQIYRLNYPLLSDPNDELARSLGLVGGQRDTIVVDKNGVVFKQYHNVDAPKHHKDLLKEIPK